MKVNKEIMTKAKINRTELVTIRLTEQEKTALNRHCIDNKRSMSFVLRAGLSTLASHDFPPPIENMDTIEEAIEDLKEIQGGIDPNSVNHVKCDELYQKLRRIQARVLEARKKLENETKKIDSIL